MRALKRSGVSSRAVPDLGPQYHDRDPFRRRMRLHQSWWRAFVLCERPGSRTRSDGTMEPLGSRLPSAAAQSGKNFLTPEIRDVALERIAEGGLSRSRMLGNLLSSQPMCINLFGPLVPVANRPLATALLRALLPDEVERVTDVRIAHAPTSPTVDGMAFDVYVEYESFDGARGFLGIETRLAEPLSSREFRVESYLPIAARHPEVWGENPSRELGTRDWSQLWRNHLLAAEHATSGFPTWRSAVIHHPEDRECATAIAGYRSVLPPGETTFVSGTLDAVVDCWRALVRHNDARRWLDDFYVRYLQLDLSKNWAESD